MQKPAMDLDQHRAISSDSLNVGGNLYLPILGEDTQNRGLDNIGFVAESWQYSGDGKTLTLKIRQMTTHKGQPFNAEDVAYNLERMRTQPNKLSLVRSGCLRPTLQKAVATGATTVVLTLEAASASFIACLSNPHILMIPKGVLQEIDGPGQGRPMQPEDVDGIGPFKFVRWVDGSLLEMERFESYFRQGLPYLDRIQLVQLNDCSSGVAAFRTQRIHMFKKFATCPGTIEADALTREFGDQVQVKEVPVPWGPRIMLNWKRSPLDNLRVREAVDLAWNRQYMRDLLGGGKGTLSGPYYCPWGWIYTCQEYETWPGYRADKGSDLARARSLLQEAGYGAEKPLTISASCGTGTPDICDLLTDDLKQIGVTLRPIRLENAVLTAQAGKGDFDICVCGRGGQANDPDDYNGLNYLPNASLNYPKWENARFSQLYEEQRGELNREKRGTILREMGKIIYDDHVLLSGMNDMLHQTWWSFVKGYVPPTEARPHQTNYLADYIWLDVAQ